jgi:hypothetical protein
MVDPEEKKRFERAVEREIVAGQRREPLWSDLLQQCVGDEKQAKRAYIAQRVEQLLAGEAKRRQKRRRKRKKRSYLDRNALSAMFGRRVIYGVMISVAVVVLFLIMLLSHTEDSRWMSLFTNESPPIPNEWDPTQ